MILYVNSKFHLSAVQIVKYDAKSPLLVGGDFLASPDGATAAPTPREGGLRIATVPDEAGKQISLFSIVNLVAATYRPCSLSKPGITARIMFCIAPCKRRRRKPQEAL